MLYHFIVIIILHLAEKCINLGQINIQTERFHVYRLPNN
jgi:hypothetical protein